VLWSILWVNGRSRQTSGHDTEEKPMLTIDDRTEVDDTSSPTSPPASLPTPRRRRTRRIATIAAATLVVAGVAGVAAIRSADSSPVERSQDDNVRDLVERGLVPAASLSDGTEISGSRDDAVRDDAVRDLVERGLVPAATLSDGTQIAGSSAP
jgi:hypothetical protein